MINKIIVVPDSYKSPVAILDQQSSISHLCVQVNYLESSHVICVKNVEIFKCSISF